MFTGPVNRIRARGFTLLEITLAAAILGMMSLAIFRFVQTNINVLRINATETMEEARYEGLLGLLTTQWQEVPSGVGALGGEPFKFNDRSRDEIVWTGGAGLGVLTRYAEGDYTVRMRLRPMKEGSDALQLGFLRRPREATEGSDEGESWVPIMDDVRGMRIRYFDPVANSWGDRWTETSRLPRLIEVIIERPNRASWQAIVALGRTGVQESR
jgi:prepilin-type N-terminal cleavage/methylation domain-containing protein